MWSRAATVPVIMAGGKKLPELDALTMASNAVRAGAAGVDMGRNIFQSADPAAMMRAVRASSTMTPLPPTRTSCSARPPRRGCSHECRRAPGRRRRAPVRRLGAGLPRPERRRRFRRGRAAAGDEFGNHLHEHHTESFVVLEGRAEIWLDRDTCKVVSVGDVLRAEPHEEHFVRKPVRRDVPSRSS